MLASMHVSPLGVYSALGSQKVTQNWNYRQLWDAVWVLGCFAKMANALHHQVITLAPLNDPSQCCDTSQPVCSPKQLCTHDGFHSIASFFRSVSYMTNRPWKQLEHRVPTTLPISYFTLLPSLPRFPQSERRFSPFSVKETRSIRRGNGLLLEHAHKLIKWDGENYKNRERL